MTDVAAPTQELLCPDCGEPLFVRHMEGGNMSAVTAVHQVSSVYWIAECHNKEFNDGSETAPCGYESDKRSTPWALIKVINRDRTST
jgi:hypothetical protein